MTLPVQRRTFFRRALELLGARPGYVWGGKTANGCDCSGFVTLPLFLAGGPDLRMSHNTDRLWLDFPRVAKADVLPGDVALYFGEHSTGADDVSHAMLVMPFELVAGMAWGGPGDTDAVVSRLAGKIALVREAVYRSDLAGHVRLPLV